ncbi:TIGR01621 family pseudouridine synthase [Simiduia curdlanivorans]|uniref:TIGR01621 family pseudouridine synthase n=1 Tax=Simiduia curdlanivorans TaxID=1492769 RepID=A0ABV8V234_9GAMM|nr:TIGR01621 family pseudouridine synthase [Simiduia curdlanivorans]MDN3640014.1 TIGR01621 family pseudouridine synthase [Simiduia curdlanivorans]
MNEGFSLVADEQDFVVVDKAPEVNFHTESGQLGIVELVRQYFGRTLWPVHRLDKMTSGLLLLAKSAEAASAFGQLFEQRAIEKYYLAICAGKPKKKQGLVKGDMSPSRRKTWKLEPTLSNPAITQFFSQSLGDGLRLYLLKPSTGKTHQLRVALKSLGVPVLGDDIYNAKSTVDSDRGYLHAYALSFNFFGKPFCYVSVPSQGELFSRPAVKEAIADYAEPASMPWPKLS